MDITIYQYNYESVVKNFTIFAPVKHGTRWLNSTKPISKTPLYPTHNQNDTITKSIEHISTILFSDKDSPFQNSKIKLKKFKRELIIQNPVIVYRDPYEAFIKAILTGTHKSNNVIDSDLHMKWDGRPETLNVVMTNNGHFSTTIWQSMWDMFERLDDNSITFVELRELSDFMMINTLEHYDYNFNDFTFEKDIVGDYTKDEILELCKEYHPILWKNFMIQIEKEKIALNKLLEKFKWNGQ